LVDDEYAEKEEKAKASSKVIRGKSYRKDPKAVIENPSLSHTSRDDDDDDDDRCWIWEESLHFVDF